MKRILSIVLTFNLLFSSVFAANIPKNEILEVYNYGSTIQAKVPITNSNGMFMKIQLHKEEQESLQEILKHIENGLINPLEDKEFQYKIISNNRNYNYYKTQLRTGNYSNLNCMAASAATITTWLDKESTWTVAEIRRSVRPQGGAIYTNEISDFFEQQGIHYSTHYFLTQNRQVERQGLVEIINRGSIIMVCADTSAISQHNNDNLLLGKEYSSSSKHSYIISGYVLFGEDLYFEVFDPADKNVQKRYFKWDQVCESIERHWNAVFEIPQQNWTSSK